MTGVLDRLAYTIIESNDLEELVRPFLEILEDVTGLESTYLTYIDQDQELQHILYAHNTDPSEFSIPEGLSVKWDDTLCKRALEERRPFTENVAQCWGDSQAAKELGIYTYISEPVRTGEGKLFGTLCGASRNQTQISAEARRLLAMLAKLIARQLERDRLLERLQQENLTYSQQALADPLTGVANRRSLMKELARALASASRSGLALHLSFIDLDGFKTINDQYGHDAGDRFLIQIAQRLTRGLRDSDFVARYGGDEFIVFGSAGVADLESSRLSLLERLEEITTGEFYLNEGNFHYPGASIGVTTSLTDETDCDALIARADAAMYRAKKARRSDR